MKTHYLDIVIFCLSTTLLVFAIMLWRSRPKMDSSKEKPSKKSKKINEQPPEGSNL
jgi:Flp pilus assembly protein TadB